jgi:S-adenosylmethionine hydrolase
MPPLPVEPDLAYITAAAHLRVLLTLFVTNSEVRKLAKDLGFVGRDIFATTASKAADKARPSQQQLDQVDQEAPSKQWVGADGKTLGPNETPDLQFKAADGSQVRYNPKDAPGNAQ